MDSDLDYDNKQDDAGNKPETQFGCLVQSRAASVMRMRSGGSTSGKYLFPQLNRASNE